MTRRRFSEKNRTAKPKAALRGGFFQSKSATAARASGGAR